MKHVISRTLLALALLSTAQMSFGVTTLGPVGGSGGNAVPARSCKTGFVTEIYGRAGAYLDQIGMKCGDQDLGTMGGSGGSPYSIKSAQGFSGINVRSGAFVDHIQPLDANGKVAGDAGGGGGNPTTLICPAGQKIIGFGGHAGDVTDSLQIICGAPGEAGSACPDEQAKADAAMAQINKSLDDAKKKLADLQQDLNKQIADDKDKSDKQIASVNDSLKTQLEKAKTDTAQNLAQNEKDLEAKVKAAQQSYAAPLKKMQDDLQAALQKTQQANAQSLTKKNQQSQQQVKTAIDTLQQLITTANGALKIIPQAKDIKDPRMQEAISRLQQLTQGV